MKRLSYQFILLFLFGTVLTVVLSMFSGRVQAKAMVCPAPSVNHATIQQALFDPDCDIVSVSSGVYTLTSDLFVDRAVTLQGAGPDLSILEGTQPDFHSDGEIISVGDTGVLTLTGFTLRNGKGFNVGGVYNEGTIIISNTRIVDNQSNNTSGGLLNFGLATLSNVEISNNWANSYGGGLHNNTSATMTMTNVTISGNSAIGGAGASNSGNLTIMNVSIVSNTERHIFAAGISNYGVLTATNSLVANSGAPNCNGTGTINSNGYNLENANTCSFTQSTDINNTDPNVGPLRANGSVLRTHALRGGAAVDAGTNVGCPAQDQRGHIRPVDGDLNGSAICDIGAYEFESKVYLPIVIKPL